MRRRWRVGSPASLDLTGDAAETAWRGCSGSAEGRIGCWVPECGAGGGAVKVLEFEAVAGWQQWQPCALVCTFGSSTLFRGSDRGLRSGEEGGAERRALLVVEAGLVRGEESPEEVSVDVCNVM